MSGTRPSTDSPPLCPESHLLKNTWPMKGVNGDPGSQERTREIVVGRMLSMRSHLEGVAMETRSPDLCLPPPLPPQITDSTDVDSY